MKDEMIAAAMQYLREQGAAPDMIFGLISVLLEVKPDVAETAPSTVTADEKRSAAALRQARYRERKASQEHNERNENITKHNTVTNVTDRDRGAAPLDPPSLPPTPPNSPPYNPPTTPVRERERATVRLASDAFERFKAAYPRREGSNPWQPAAQKFEAKVRAGADPEAIIAGAMAYARSVVGADPRFTAQAVTWLNQERWKDDHSPVQTMRNQPRDERTPLARAFDSLRSRVAETVARDRGGFGEDGHPVLDLSPVATR